MKNSQPTLLWLVLLSLVSCVSATEYYLPSEFGWTYEIFPDTACSYLDPGFSLHMGNNVEGTGASCYSAIQNGTAYAYMRFTNIVPGTSVKLNCSQVWNYPPRNAGSVLKLYRIYEDWDNNTLTYNNQPAYCSGNGTCWNVYGGIESDRGSSVNQCGPCGGVEWDLTAGGLYGGDMPDLYNVSVFFADDSGIDSDYVFRFNQPMTGLNCTLIVDGLYNYSVLTVYTMVNYVATPNIMVDVCSAATGDCAHSPSNESGYVEFTVPYGTYTINATFSGETASITTELTNPTEHRLLWLTCTECLYNTSIYYGYVYQNGVPVQDAVVQLFGDISCATCGDEPCSTITDASGYFSILGLAPSTYNAQAFKDGKYNLHPDVELTGQPYYDVFNLPYDDAGWIRVTVVNKTTSPIEDVLVSLISCSSYTGYPDMHSYYLDVGLSGSCSAILVSPTNASGIVVFPLSTMPDSIIIQAEKVGYKRHVYEMLIFSTTPSTLIVLDTEKQFSFRVHVYNIEDETPIQYATARGNIVGVGSGEAISDANGYANFTIHKPVGFFSGNVVVTHDSYHDLTIPRDQWMIFGDTVLVSAGMKPITPSATVNISGHVNGTYTVGITTFNEAISGLLMELKCVLYDDAFVPTYETYLDHTDSDGFYNITGVRINSYCDLSTKSSSFWDNQQVSFQANQNRDIDFLLTKVMKYQFNGDVSDCQTGGMIEGAKVYIYQNDGWSDWPYYDTVRTDWLGGFSFGQLIPPGNYSVEISKDNYFQVDFIVNINQNRDIDICLSQEIGEYWMRGKTVVRRIDSGGNEIDVATNSKVYILKNNNLIKTISTSGTHIGFWEIKLPPALYHIYAQEGLMKSPMYPILLETTDFREGEIVLVLQTVYPDPGNRTTETPYSPGEVTNWMWINIPPLLYALIFIFFISAISKAFKRT